MGSNIRFKAERHRLLALHLARYWRMSLAYLTPLRAANAVLNHLEFRLGRTKLLSYPPMIKVEATLDCNLGCPGCIQVLDGTRKRINGTEEADPEQLDKLLSQVNRRSIGVNLAYRGEAIIHPRILDLVRVVKKHRMAAFFPTNLSTKRDDSFFEELVDSGVDALSVALDGASKETYKRYRRGGDFDLVLENVATLAAIKRRKGSKTPHLRWKFICFDHNRHEVERVATEYRSLGFDSYEINHDRAGALHIEGRRKRNLDILSGKERCFYPWSTLIVLWDGDAHPCFNEEVRFQGLGNLYGSGGFIGTWNGAAYQALRRGHTGTIGNATHSSCVTCVHQDVEPEAIVARLIPPQRLTRRSKVGANR
jgi:MoaA/NifB/PqqE/SkfB family radical SAM enzyme